MNRDWTPKQEAIIREALALASDHPNAPASELAAGILKVYPDFGKTEDAIRLKIRRMRSGVTANEIRANNRALLTPNEYKEHQSTDGRVLESKSERITTLEQLLAVADVDRSLWEVDHFIVNKWDVGATGPDGNVVVTELYQVKAWLKRKAGIDLALFKSEIFEALRAHKPDYRFVPPPACKDGHLLEISPFDLHIGKLAWDKETGGESYDSSIACRILERAIEELVTRAKAYPVSEILFVVGQDLLHTDGLLQTTTGGTRQDADSRHQKMFTVAWRAMQRAIDVLRLVAPVTVKIVPGNHDRDSAFKLGEVLYALYDKPNSNVIVDNAPTLRKYHRFGNVLLGFTHGCDEKPADLPLIMANERKQDWSDTHFHEWHVGHLHKKKETRFTAGDTANGVGITILPSLSGTDAWHAQMGYVKGPRAAQAFLYHPTYGEVARYTSNYIEQ